MNAESGKFVISLDFEILWGVRDSFSIKNYSNHLTGVQTALPKLLDIFRKHKINSTVATVGLLFFETKKQLHEFLNFPQPQYINKSLSPYIKEVFEVGESAYEDIYHFAPDLINKIKKFPEHEIATHTFSHYYCLEEGQTIDDFREDIRAAVTIAAQNNIAIKSIVFPRNQFNDKYLQICEEFGISSVRGNEQSWMYKSRSGEKETNIRRAFRLIDTYINISGQHCYTDEYMGASYPYNIPSSRFLRQYKKKLSSFEGLRLNRIKKAMTHAAKNNLTYHLWWHPHNFGVNQDENFSFLEKILLHYDYLSRKYNFKSYTMAEVSDHLHKKYGK